MTDESIEEYEHHEYEPITGTNLNNPGEIRINIETQDLFTHPSESYLIFEGRLTKADGTTYTNADEAALTTNALMHLFSNIKYQLSSQEIESLFHPGQGTTMLGLLKYPDDFSKSQGLNQLWYKDTGVTASTTNNTGFKIRQSYLIQFPDPKGSFSFRVPLKHIFGFCEDYDKIVYGLKQTLTLVRKSDNDAIFRDAANGRGKVWKKCLGLCLMLCLQMLKNINSIRLSNQSLLYMLLTGYDNVIQSQFLNLPATHGV